MAEMSKKLCYIYFICIIFSAHCNTIDLLQNYTVYELSAFNSRERASLFYLYQRDDTVFFLNGVTNEASIPMDVGVIDSNAEKFEKKLQSNDVQYSYNPQMHVPNLDQLLYVRNLNFKDMLRSDSEGEDDSFSDTLVKFNNFDQIEAWSAKKARLFSMVEKKILSTTYEKRKLFLLKISTSKKKCAVFIIAGEEGRDWVSPAVALNFVDNLLESPRYRPLLSNYDFYVIPVFNPDGYEYSRKHDRFWCKNRREFFLEKKCMDNLGTGVNVDRNWFFAENAPYATEWECNSVYAGQKSVSEEETKALAYILNKVAKKLMAFINIRGFERAITIPYAHNSEITSNHNLMMQILGSVTAKLRSLHNVSYFHETTARLLYNFSGNCADWVKKNLNVPVVYSVYMKDQDNFLPVSSEIKPLTNQFLTIVNETLLIAYDIYGPLFNSTSYHRENTFNLILCLLMVIILQNFK